MEVSSKDSYVQKEVSSLNIKGRGEEVKLYHQRAGKRREKKMIIAAAATNPLPLLSDIRY